MHFMKILIVGGGGREHAIAWKLSQESSRLSLFCAPGNAGTAQLAENLPLTADNIEGLVAWATANQPNLTIIGPELPLCMGLTDRLQELNLRVFGPSRAAAQIEGSKLFAKDIMRAAGVPTAKALSFNNADQAIAALPEFSLPVVIKADGIAAGKGVIIAESQSEAVAAIKSMLETRDFGEAGNTILIEEFLEGEEASILALSDGKNVVLLPSSQDHKRVFDNDEGANTGGMGAYSPAPIVTTQMMSEIKDSIISPVINELAQRGIVYKGVLYAGLMIGTQGIKVLEFNARFGDPETQAVLPRIDGDLLPALLACVDGGVYDEIIQVKPESAVTVIMASEGYPGKYSTGKVINGLEQANTMPASTIFHCGTAMKDDQVVSAGGRVLAVTALGSTLPLAVKQAYATLNSISFEGVHYRKDIAHRALRQIGN